jgi:hypothetical protein
VAEGNATAPTGTPGGRTLRSLALFAAVGPVVYVLAVVLGGLLWPGYSQYGETVSTLLSRGAPNQELLVPLFAIYNLGGLALAIGLQRAVRRSRFGDAGPLFLGAAAATGLILFLFPQGPWSAPLSGTGIAHTAVAGLQALLSLLALGFLGRRLAADPAWKGLGRFTLALLVVAVVLGGFGAVSVTAPYAGLAERASIGTFLVWTETMAVALFLWSTPRSGPRPAGRGMARGAKDTARVNSV